MKKVIISTFLLLASTTMYAQSVVAFSQSKNGTTVDSYTLPRTAIKVTLTQEREVIIRGPYARYASQYLGIIGAAQTDKENFKLLGASANYVLEPDPMQTYLIDEKAGIPTRVFHWLETTAQIPQTSPADADFSGAKITNNNPFKDMGATILETQDGSLPIDRTSTSAKSPDQMAAEAAATIFKLRKKRIELICAEQGENVFGAGLDAALKEISRLEQEYLELFIGKRYTQLTSKTYTVLPEKGKNRVVACRFSDAKGLSDATDLAAAPVNIEITALSDNGAQPAKKLNSKSIAIAIPITATVKISFGENVLDTQQIPVYQFGNIIMAPVM